LGLNGLYFFFPNYVIPALFCWQTLHAIICQQLALQQPVPYAVLLEELNKALKSTFKDQIRIEIILTISIPEYTK